MLTRDLGLAATFPSSVGTGVVLDGTRALGTAPPGSLPRAIPQPWQNLASGSFSNPHWHRIGRHLSVSDDQRAESNHRSLNYRAVLHKTFKMQKFFLPALRARFRLRVALQTI
jgi:hypothetical protein